MKEISNKKPKIASLSTVRTHSTRLPNKPLMDIRGKRVIDHIIERMKSAKTPDLCIICTSDRPEDDVLVSAAKMHGVEYFRGSAEDRLERMLGAVNRFNLDYIVTTDADDIFCDPELIDLAIEQVINSPCDVMRVPDGLPCGAFTFLISANTLHEACRIKGTTDTEMYEEYILDNDKFSVTDLKVEDPIFFNDKIRATLDYKEDLDFFRSVFDEMQIDRNIVPLKDIIRHINNKPELALINYSRHKDYLAKRDKMRQNTKII